MDERELDDLYRQWGGTIYRRCVKLLADRAAAEDATQEVFIRLLKHKDRLVPGTGYLGWIYKVATNHCLNRLRDDARLVLRGDLLEDSMSGATDGGAGRYVEHDLSVRILRRFDDETQSIAVLSLVDGMGRDEVAAALGLSRKTVGKKLERFLTDARKYAARVT